MKKKAAPKSKLQSAKKLGFTRMALPEATAKDLAGGIGYSWSKRVKC